MTATRMLIMLALVFLLIACSAPEGGLQGYAAPVAEGGLQGYAVPVAEGGLQGYAAPVD
jgi:hypothetical protein